MRLSTREEHIKYLKKIKKKLILAGPILDKNDNPVGTVLIVDFDELAAVKKFLYDDPYSKVNLFQEVEGFDQVLVHLVGKYSANKDYVRIPGLQVG